MLFNTENSEIIFKRVNNIIGRNFIVRFDKIYSYGSHKQHSEPKKNIAAVFFFSSQFKPSLSGGHKITDFYVLIIGSRLKWSI